LLLHFRETATDEKETTLAAQRAVAAFLRAYAPGVPPTKAAAGIEAQVRGSLLESELLQRVLLGVIDTVKPESLSGAVRRGVDVFLSGYERR
jgi:hypothetical protein